MGNYPMPTLVLGRTSYASPRGGWQMSVGAGGAMLQPPRTSLRHGSAIGAWRPGHPGRM